jgi:hypothetical protein
MNANDQKHLILSSAPNWLCTDKAQRVQSTTKRLLRLSWPVCALNRRLPFTLRRAERFSPAFPGFDGLAPSQHVKPSFIGKGAPPNLNSYEARSVNNGWQVLHASHA